MRLQTPFPAARPTKPSAILRCRSGAIQIWFLAMSAPPGGVGKLTKTDALVENEPAWLGRLRRSAFAVVFFAAGALVGQVTDVAEGLSKLYDRYLGEPEAFAIADRSAKAIFSDQLAQRAWRRLFWANNFRLRVQNAAPLADIDASWKSYIDADADWNANVMSAIVGLSRHYDAKRSARFEGPIQERFSKLDDELAALRNSEVVRALRDGRPPNDQERATAKILSERVKAASDNVELYALVRCILPPRESTSDDKKNLCL
jgi:hypothetical protein